MHELLYQKQDVSKSKESIKEKSDFDVVQPQKHQSPLQNVVKMQQTIQQLQAHGKNHQIKASVKTVPSLHQLALHSGQMQKKLLQSQMDPMQVLDLESIALRSVL